METTKKQQNRHIPVVLTPHGEKGVGNRQSQSLVSYGTKEKELLGALIKSEENQSHFSIKGYSKLKGIPRTTLYSILEKFLQQNLVEKNLVGYKLTTQGRQQISFLGVSEGGVGISRWGCRKGVSETNLSVHKIKFKMSLKDDNNFQEKYLLELKPQDWRAVQLPNFKMYILYFAEATIIFKKKTVEIYVGEVAGKSLEESFLDIFSTATKYAHKLEQLSLVKDNIEMEKAHYARVESIFATVLEKIDGKYRLDLGEGKFFWIDTSFKLEDETNDDEIRQKLDQNLTEMFHSEATFKDIDKIILALGTITKIQRLDISGIGSSVLTLAESQKNSVLQMGQMMESLKTLIELKKLELNGSPQIQEEEPKLDKKLFYVG